MKRLHLRSTWPLILLLAALAGGFWLARLWPTAATALAATPLTTGDEGGPPSTQGACAAPVNPIVAENCHPGSDAWQIQFVNHNYTQPLAHSIEGFASAASVAAGDSLSFYVNTDAPALDLLIFRSGYYGGKGGRQLLSVRGLPGRVQPACRSDPALGLTSCSNWTASYQLSVPNDWVSGVYLAKLVRSDGQAENEVVFVVRDDRRPAPILAQISLSTFQAYNNYAGKSLYSFDSVNLCPTVTGAPRAVAVSFDRPLAEPSQTFPNTYFWADYPLVYWLESQGYDVGYAADVDVHRWGQAGQHNALLDHRAFLSIGHDEYWSAERRAAVTAARDAGVHLGFFSSNVGYWRVRYAPDPWTGEPDKVLVTYKTTEGGGPDPSGAPTSTWRDPLGANQPENALVGEQYFGDNDSQYFPLRVSAAQARDRLYRHTGLEALPPGSSVDIGQNLVGWEWDAAVDNGHSPAGLVVLADSPVVGVLLSDAGRHSALGAASAQTTRYTAASGAIVFASGTNVWSWGLALHEPDARIRQMTYNLLADMGAQPATPAAGLVLDGAPAARAPAQPPVTAPMGGPASRIANLEVVPADDSVTIRWTTDAPAGGQVWILQTAGILDWAAPGQSGQPLIGSAVEATLALSHTLVVRGLLAGKVYYAQVAVMDAARQATISDKTAFQTKPGSPWQQARQALRPVFRAAACVARANPWPWLAAGIGAPLALVTFAIYGRSRPARRRRAR